MKKAVSCKEVEEKRGGERWIKEEHNENRGIEDEISARWE
jgi:hypothetical protein